MLFLGMTREKGGGWRVNGQLLPFFFSIYLRDAKYLVLGFVCIIIVIG